MKKSITIIALSVFSAFPSFAQVGIGTKSPNANAVLEISSTTNGVLFPRMDTATRNTITLPAKGLTIFNTTLDCIQTNTGTPALPVWECFNAGDATFDALSQDKIVFSYNNAGGAGSVQGIVNNNTNKIEFVVNYSGGSGPYSAYTSIPVAVIGEGGDSNNLTISYPAGNFSAVGSLTVTVTVDGDASFNVLKQLQGNTQLFASLPFQVNGISKSNLTLTAVSCGAYVAAGVYKTFLCHNLGATTTADPNLPAEGLNGHYYQWGRSTHAATANDIVGNWSGSNVASNSWQNNNKTANDPCPAGYRVPTNQQWNYIANNPAVNFVSRTGSWANDGNFTTAIHFGLSNGTKTLTLPAAGLRGGGTGTLSLRGSNGRYWSSTSNGGAEARNLDFTISTNTSGNSQNRAFGFSVRCISE